ncbi:flagellar hook-basal body complex protein [Defluviitoga tunisiensis]|uniref:Flagellar hook protein FlgE n=1 Tax=Defluviitoga tunisiensis TaxID=1006576 RepID=A0A0C7P079_DEFTU|nr:flagellar hook-basal body complex protein [Defluviitoga tunisiensis]CEP77434.1 flagellar hook protein FlgE [Defluviitoga tunisiensis]
MLRSMYSGITGLRNFQDQLDVVANNIANVNTIGFKGSRTTFQSTLFQTLAAGNAPQDLLGGINPMQIGLGSKIASIDKLMTQGSPMSTGKTTDMMIQGEGFFILSDGVGQYYTRAGNFTRDYNGFFVDPASGMKLQGWTARLTPDGQRIVDTNDPIGDIQISSGQVMPAKQTSFVKLAHNLNAGVGIQDTTIVIKSTLGENIPVRFSFERDLNNLNQNVYLWEAKILDTNYNFSNLADNTSSAALTPTQTINGKVELDDYGKVINWVNYAGDDSPLSDTRISIFDVNGNIVGIDGEPVTIGTNNNNNNNTGTLSGSIKLVDATTNELVYYNPEDIQLSFDYDNNNNNYSFTITLKDSQGQTIDFNYTTNNGTVGEFNQLLSEGIVDDTTSPNYKLTGLSIKGVDDSDTINTTTTINLRSVRDVIQPPVAGEIKFVDMNNPTNFATAEYISPKTTTSTVVYDSLGNSYNVYLNFTKINENTWFWEAKLDDGTPLYKITTDEQLVNDPANGVIAFDSNGNLAATNWSIVNGNIVQSGGTAGFWFDPAEQGAALNPDVNPPSIAAAGPVMVSVNFQELTQFAAPHSIAVTEQDGNAQGTLDSFAINTNGEIIGIFSNGLTAPLGQVALATFNNPEGLLEVGNSMYAMSSNSGLPQIGVSGVGGRGSIIPGALEMSNVDLAEEFTNMIIAQRGFQANSRSITTADQILNELVNIKR